MLERLGIKKIAYDFRAEHVPTFDAEVGRNETAWRRVHRVVVSSRIER